jgi:hypothetical protein
MISYLWREFMMLFRPDPILMHLIEIEKKLYQDDLS